MINLLLCVAVTIKDVFEHVLFMDQLESPTYGCSILSKIMLFDCVSVLLEHHLPLACVWKQMNLHYS